MNKCLLILLFLLSYSGYSQTKSKADTTNCDRFRNGEFRIRADANAPATRISRKGNVQLERIEGEEGSSDFIVTWLDDCVYRLTPSKETLRKYTGLPENAYITVKIIEVKVNSYIQTSSSNFADLEVTTEVFRID